MRFLTADASGAASLTVTAQPWHCGALYQTIDMSTCDVSGVASF